MREISRKTSCINTIRKARPQGLVALLPSVRRVLVFGKFRLKLGDFLTQPVVLAVNVDPFVGYDHSRADDSQIIVDSALDRAEFVLMIDENADVGKARTVVSHTLEIGACEVGEADDAVVVFEEVVDHFGVAQLGEHLRRELAFLIVGCAVVLAVAVCLIRGVHVRHDCFPFG